MAKARRMTKLTDSKPLVLVLEDEAIIALNLQDDLQDAGHEVAGPFATCSAALEWLQTATPDLAILDATLKDGPCREIALELSRCDVPFLIYSPAGSAASGRVCPYHLDRKARSVCRPGSGMSAASRWVRLNYQQ
jgi:response regulator RpfG family c-di-GMP phosphodiesterase